LFHRTRSAPQQAPFRAPLPFIQQALFRAPQSLSRGNTYSVA
jgi:hypothetical protein